MTTVTNTFQVLYDVWDQVNHVLRLSGTSAAQGTLTDVSGSITTGGSAQVLAAANTNRRYFSIQNISTASLWIDFGATAVQDQPSVRLKPGDIFIMEHGFVSTQAISIIGANTGQKFSAREASVSTGAAHGALTNRSGTIAAGGVSQQVAAANSARQYFMFQNVSSVVMWINFGVAAVADQPSMQILPGSTLLMESNFVSTEAINVICATISSKFVSKEG